MKENVERWLSFAREDLAAAKAVLKEDLFNQTCFHAQQCVEKALKAVVAASDVAAPKTHSVSELCTRIPPTLLAERREGLMELDDFYIPTRYPDALPGSLPDGLPAMEDAKRLLEMAEAALREVSSYLAHSTNAAGKGVTP